MSARTITLEAAAGRALNLRSASTSASGISGGDPPRTWRSSLTYTAPVYPQSHRDASAAAICRESLSGAQRSSSSQKEIQGADASAMPRLRAALGPDRTACWTNRRGKLTRRPKEMTVRRRRRHRRQRHRSPPRVDARRSPTSRRRRSGRLRVGMTTVTCSVMPGSPSHHK